MGKRRAGPHKWVAHTVLKCFRALLEARSDIKVAKNDTIALKPPYLVIGNHVNNWDPFLVNAYIEHPIRYVMTDTYFRFPVLRQLLNYAGAIPKRKFMSDLAVVKRIIQARNNNQVIGVFPEGSRNWDGVTGEIIPSTAKLVKLLKIPVVAAKIRGGYLSSPRWSKSFRKGQMELSYSQILDSEQIETMSVNEIHACLVAGLAHDEYAYQKQHMNLYQGKALAEQLERLIFACPSCKAMGSMASSGNEFFCQKCNYRVLYNEYGFFEGETDICYHNLRDWNLWQLDHLYKQLDTNGANPMHLLLREDRVSLYTGQKGMQLLKKVDVGNLMLNARCLYLEADSGKVYDFDLTHISGLNIQYNSRIEFYLAGQLYRFAFLGDNYSPFMWLKALKYQSEKAIETTQGSCYHG